MKKALAFCLILLAGCKSTETAEEPALPPQEVMEYDMLSWEPVDVHPSRASFYGISFRLPEGWTYDTMTEDENPSGSLIVSVFTPDDNEQPVLRISSSDAAGVCGTGLVQKELEFNGIRAFAGYYDGHTVWDFIYLTGDLEGCMIVNTAGERYAQYEEEISQILSTVEFKYYD